MTVRILLIGLCVASLGAGALARAPAKPVGGWEFAHWNMTRAQVRAASGGRVTPGADPAEDSVAGGTSLGPFKFDVILQYAGMGDDSDRLTAVELDYNGPGKCDAIRPYLAKQYGSPGKAWENEGTIGSSWTDPKTGDQIDFEHMQDITCEVRYDPPAGTEGQ